MKFWIVAVLSQTMIAAAAQADPLLIGRQTVEMFLGGDVAAIWSRSTSEMQSAFGSVEHLELMRDDLLTDFGTEETILSERTEDKADHDIYMRISRWTESTAPIEFLIAFDDAKQIAGFFIRPQAATASSSYLDYQTKTRLHLPFEGEWFVYWGGRDIKDNYHAVDAGQRFALDLLILRNGKSHIADPKSLESYHCWGQPILSPADGVVMRAIDGLPDQVIGLNDTANPAGNHVVIDFGNGEYGFLAHLRQDSVQVAKGDPVTLGQQIGQCGNSGNTTEPHLHFHMQTSPKLGHGEGLPAQFTNYQANGTLIDRGEPRKGQTLRPAE
ncbi:MAG: M23 family metallopeptidase [Paracoccus sp. (in: a-proteobacteria)]|uniref:M23 family metallopeptidase n=1 Tax=Paracoccus sp. TaxID=267 RepID=UPI0039E2C047